MMMCPHCNSEMQRDEEAYGNWHCFECNYDALCRRCGNNPVHPHRKWQVCLDCICDLLVENGSIQMNPLWKEKINDSKSVVRKRLENEKNNPPEKKVPIKKEDMILMDVKNI